MRYKLMRIRTVKDSSRKLYELIDMEKDTPIIVSKDQLCFLVGKGEVEGLTGQLYQGKVIIHGIEKELDKVIDKEQEFKMNILCKLLIPFADYIRAIVGIETCHAFEDVFNIIEHDIQRDTDGIICNVRLGGGGIKNNTVDNISITLNIDNKTFKMRRIKVSATSGTITGSFEKELNNIEYRNSINKDTNEYTIPAYMSKEIALMIYRVFANSGMYINEIETHEYYYSDLSKLVYTEVKKHKLENPDLVNKAFHFFFVIQNVFNCVQSRYESNKDKYAPFSLMEISFRDIENIGSNKVFRVDWNMQTDKEAFGFASYDLEEDTLTICSPEIDSEDYNEIIEKYSNLNFNKLASMMDKSFKKSYQFHQHMAINKFLDSQK